MQTLPFEGHNVAYQCKGRNQSNIVCEYEVNLSTIKYQMSRSSIGQGHHATCW